MASLSCPNCGKHQLYQTYGGPGFYLRCKACQTEFPAKQQFRVMGKRGKPLYDLVPDVEAWWKKLGLRVDHT